MGAADPDWRGSDAAPAEGGAYRTAVPSPTSRHLVAVLISASTRRQDDPVSPTVLADRVHSARGAAVARARLLADRPVVLEARAHRATSGGGGGRSHYRASRL